jgi:hypothetical protein
MERNYKVGDRVLYEGYECVVAFIPTEGGETVWLELPYEFPRGWGKGNGGGMLDTYKSVLSDRYWAAGVFAVTPIESTSTVNNNYSLI